MTDRTAPDPPATPLHERIAARVLRYVSDPPADPTPVIRFASPEELHDAFNGSVGLDLSSGAAYDDEALLAAVDDVIRLSMHTTHPRFMNQNFAGPDPVAVVGDWLGAALNTTNATYEVAPVFTLMERAALSRLAALAGYPVPGSIDEPAPGLFCAGGSMATLLALQLARHRHQPDMVTRGAGTERMMIFVSDAGHYAAKKSAALLGLGTDAVFEVATDHAGAMLPDALAAAVAECRAESCVPLAVIATAGTTVTAAFDPLDAVADICEANDMWLHVDGCYGGSALFSPSQQHRLHGVARSDSFVWNLHKMMGMTQQCTALLVREPARLGPCFATGADYIFQPDKEFGALDAGDRTFMCGRRVDVLKLWLAWKTHGDAGFASRVDHAVALAEHARARVAGSGGAFRAIVAGDFTNVCFVWVPPDMRPLPPGELTDADKARLHTVAPTIKARMQRDGTAMVGVQPVHGVNSFRFIFMNPAVRPADIDDVLDLIGTHGAAIAPAHP